MKPKEEAYVYWESEKVFETCFGLGGPNGNRCWSKSYDLYPCVPRDTSVHGKKELNHWYVAQPLLDGSCGKACSYEFNEEVKYPFHNIHDHDHDDDNDCTATCFPANDTFGGVSTVSDCEEAPFKTCFQDSGNPDNYCWTNSVNCVGSHFPCVPNGFVDGWKFGWIFEHDPPRSCETPCQAQHQMYSLADCYRGMG